MSSRPFDQLPNEVLLHIFVKGVEDESHDPWRGDSCGLKTFARLTRQESHDPWRDGFCRRLKTFARLARQVCARWKTIIDNPPSSVSFWIAYLSLRTTRPDDPFHTTFARQLATFHHLLLSSNGCDLAITFTLYDLSVEMANDVSYPYTTPMLRLVIYAMEMITPYHDQVIELGVYYAAPVVHSYLLRLVATRWTKTSRLLAVAFSGITNTPTELSLSSLPSYKKILPETSKGVSSPLSLTHFRNLDTLSITACLWIKWGVHLPPNLQHLNLEVSDVTLANLFAFLQTQTNSLASLQSIRIGKSMDAIAEEIEDQEEAKRPTGQSLGQSILPLLHRISLDGFLVWDVLGFLGILSCRSLESLSIELRGQKEIDQSSLSIDFPSKFPRLVSSKLRFNVGSWQSLHYLEIFTSLPIQWLQVSFENYKPDWVDDLISFRIALSNLQLQQLTIKGPYWVSHYLLASLDTQNLTRLNIWPTYLNLERFPPMDRDSEIVAPHLKKLEFREREDHFIHFLSHLEATQLVRFDYSSNASESTVWDREKALQVLSTKSFASVWFTDLELSHVDQFLPHVAHLFPNLDRLRIRIRPWADDVMDDNAIPHLIRDVIPPLCDALAPTITTVPFPQLRSLTGECSLYSRKSQSTAKWLDVTREEVRRMLQEMLTSRAKGGGLPLRTESIKFEDNSKYVRAIVMFEAHEALSVKLERDK